MYKTASEIAVRVLEKCAKEEKKREALYAEYGTRPGDIAVPLGTGMLANRLRLPLAGAYLSAALSAPKGEGVGRGISAMGGAMGGGILGGVGGMGAAKLFKLPYGKAKTLYNTANFAGTLLGAATGNRFAGRQYDEAKELRRERARKREERKRERKAAEE